MIRELPSRRLFLCAAGSTVVLAACTATPPARLFTLAPRPGVILTPTASAAPAGSSAPAVATRRTRTAARSGSSQAPEPTKISVKPVQIPKYLDRPQMVRYGNPYQLNANEFERWGEGFSDMTTRVLVENLAQRLPHAQVFSSSGALSASGDVSLEVDVMRFEPDDKGSVALDARWAALRRDGSHDRIRSEQIVVAMPSDDAEAQVASMSEALGQLADRIASELSTVRSARS